MSVTNSPPAEVTTEDI